MNSTKLLKISPLLIRAYRHALDTRKWAQTWSSSIVTLIHKEGKDAPKRASYRPISLLNMDHNLISSILANRLKDTTTDIINPNQCKFIPGRLQADNIRRTLNIIDYAQREKEELLLMTLDAEKVFDLVSWPFMFQIIKSFGMDDTFCQWLQILYSKPVSIVVKQMVPCQGNLASKEALDKEILSFRYYLLYTLRCWQ